MTSLTQTLGNGHFMFCKFTAVERHQNGIPHGGGGLFLAQFSFVSRNELLSGPNRPGRNQHNPVQIP